MSFQRDQEKWIVPYFLTLSHSFTLNFLINCKIGNPLPFSMKKLFENAVIKDIENVFFSNRSQKFDPSEKNYRKSFNTDLGYKTDFSQKRSQKFAPFFETSNFERSRFDDHFNDFVPIFLITPFSSLIYARKLISNYWYFVCYFSNIG